MKIKWKDTFESLAFLAAVIIVIMFILKIAIVAGVWIFGG